MKVSGRGLAPFVSVALLLASMWSALPASAQEAKESSPAALAVYADAANFQNGKEWQLAVMEWSKFLSKYPTDPMADSAQHYLGVCYMQTEPPQLDKAAESFQAVVTKHPKFKEMADTLLNLGWCQYSLAQQGVKPEENYAAAADVFAKLAALKDKHVDQALYFQGESLYLLDKKPEAIAAYAALVKDFPKSNRLADTLYALGVTQEELKMYPEAGKTYDQFLAGFADSSLANEVKMRKAETVLQAGEFADAEKRFAEVVAVEGFPLVDLAIHRQAFCALKQDKFAEAAALYASIPTKYPMSVNAPVATVDAGRSYYRAGMFPEARTWFAKVLAAGGVEAPEAAHWICRIDLRDKKYAEAAQLAAKTIPAAAESEYLVNLKLDQADATYELEGKQADALAMYVALAKDHPQDALAPQALYNAAYAALQLKKYDEGLAHANAFLKAFADHPLTPDVKYVAAECNLHSDKPAEAEKLYTDLAKNYPEHADLEQWQLRLGLSLFLQQKYAETVAALADVVGGFKGKDNLAEAQFLIGTSQFYGKKYQEAVEALNASLAANPQWRQADETLLNLARSQRDLDQVDPAIATLKKLIAGFPQSSVLDRAHFRLAQYSYGKGDYNVAASEYGLVASENKESILVPHALYGQGWAFLQQQDYKGGEGAFTKLITDHADHKLVAEAHNSRAICRHKLANYQGGIADVDVYLKSNPGQPDKSNALYVRGLCQSGLKEYDGAATTLASILAENKDYASADKVLYELAWSQKSADKNEEAVKTFNRLATEAPDSPLAAEAFYHVAESQYEAKEFEAAAKSYFESQKRAGKSDLGEKSTYKLAWAFYQQKDYPKALTAFSSQVDSYPEGKLMADGLFMKAECAFKLENYEEALAAYQKAITVPASNAEIETLILLHGGQAAGQLKQWDASLKLLDQVVKKFPESPSLPEVMFEQAQAKRGQGDLEAAQALYAKVADNIANRNEVGAKSRMMVGEILFAKKAFPAAILEFKKVMLGYGGNNAPAEIKRWQAQSGYEAARCYEVQIEAAKGAERTQLIAEAIKEYEYVVKAHPAHELAAKAKARLVDLAKLK